jgi:hypothetical protein
MCEDIECISFTDIIDLMFNIFSITIYSMSDLSIIYHCTPLQCQLERRLLNELNPKINHTNHGWINHLFNSHYVSSHQLIKSTITLVLQMMGMKAMIHKLVWMITYGIPMHWREFRYINSNKTNSRMMLVSLMLSSKS